MKTRRVFVTLEIETDAPLGVLRDRRSWTGKTKCPGSLVLQAQANVAREIKPKRKRAKRKA